MKKRIVSILLAAVLGMGISACNNDENNSDEKNSSQTSEDSAATEDDASESGESAELTIAYQPGIIYAPITIMKENKLIEKHYGSEVTINWQELTSGSAINEGFTAGDIDVAALGVSPAIVGVQAGVPYKIFAGVSSVPYGIMTNQEEVKTLKDFKKEDQIALVALNSYPHIALAMAAKAEMGDAHALDTNLVALSIPDGFSALISGTIQGQVASAPYNYLLAEEDGIHAVEIGEDVWVKGDTGILGVASTALYEENPKLYEALCSAIAEATDLINNNTEEVAEILAKDYDDVDTAKMTEWLKDPKSVFSTDLQGVMKTAAFMHEEGFMDNIPEDLSSLVFDNVKGD